MRGEPAERISPLFGQAQVSHAPAAPAKRNRPSRLGAVIAWLLTCALIGALLWVGYAWRTDIVRAWPPSERLYQALGIARS